jgi:hypothetical protein
MRKTSVAYVHDRYLDSGFMSYSAKCSTNIQQMPLEVSSRSAGQQNYLVLNEGNKTII